jgi:hypothetical protein
MLAGICDGKFAASRAFGNLKFETIDNRFALYGLKMTSSGLVQVDESCVVWQVRAPRNFNPRIPYSPIQKVFDVPHLLAIDGTACMK